MIMQRQPDGSYEQIGFIKSKNGENIDTIVDGKGDVYFTQGFTREISGAPPLILDAIGKNALDYKIYGNSVQDGTPTPENPIEVLSVGDKTKNLFNKNDATVKGFINVDGGISQISVEWFTTENFIKCSGSISLQAKNGLGRDAYISCYDSNKVLLGCVKQNSSNDITNTIQLIEGTEYIKTCCRENNLDSYQLELGSEATAYEPYGYKIPVVASTENNVPKTTNIYLDEPLRKIGDYADVIDFERGVVERKIGKLVFTGNENFISEHLNLSLFALNMTGYSRKLEITSLSSHYQVQANVTGYNLVLDMRCTFYANPTATMYALVYIRDSRFSTVNDFKAYLKEQYDAGTPVTVYYVLADPTTEPISIPSIPTFDGTTVISTNTEIQPSSMEITYKAKKKTEV